ncbi:MAG: T9SS type A sorting domain-containing protein [Bacteroidota bacterium]
MDKTTPFFSDDDFDLLEDFLLSDKVGDDAMTVSVLDGGTASNSIFEINPTTRTLINTISITTNSGIDARMCTYDASLDNGSGGFWIADFDTDIVSVDMSGNELSVIPLATHGIAGVYGGAVDDLGNLYLYNQGGENQDQISIIDLASGTQVETDYDVFANITSQLGATSSLAGGLFISEDAIAGKKVVIGLSQGNPDILFAIDFGINLSLKEIIDSNNTIKFYPNPSNDFIQISGLKNQLNYKIFNVLGTQVRTGAITNNEKIDIKKFSRGLYFLRFENGATIKFLKE